MGRKRRKHRRPRGHIFFGKNDPARVICRPYGLGVWRARVTFCFHQDHVFYGTDGKKLRARAEEIAAEVEERGCYVETCFRNGGHI